MKHMPSTEPCIWKTLRHVQVAAHNIFGIWLPPPLLLQNRTSSRQDNPQPGRNQTQPVTHGVTAQCSLSEFALPVHVQYL